MRLVWLFVLDSYAISLGDEGVEPIVWGLLVILVSWSAIEQIYYCL